MYASHLPEPPVPPLVLHSMPFDTTELQHAFEHASVHKAVCPEAFPNIYLRALAPALTHWTFRMLQSMWIDRPFEVPQPWKDAWLTLLAKRQVKTPAHVRPIALTDSIGKIILGLTTRSFETSSSLNCLGDHRLLISHVDQLLMPSY